MKWIKTVFIAAGMALTYLFGTFDAALIALIVFIALDYLTGVLSAVINKKLSSSIGLLGIARKSLIFAVLIMAVTLDRLIGPGNRVFRTIVCYFYISNEGISIIENLARSGIPVPEKLTGVLQQLRKRGGADEEPNGGSET